MSISQKLSYGYKSEYLMTDNASIHVGVVEAHQGGDDGNGAGTSHARR